MLNPLDIIPYSFISPLNQSIEYIIVELVVDALTITCINYELIPYKPYETLSLSSIISKKNTLSGVAQRYRKDDNCESVFFHT